VHALLVARIEALKLSAFFRVTDRMIECIPTQSEILFAGLWANLDSIKSLNDLSLAWVEESESISAQSVQILTPTIRGSHQDHGAGAEIWFSCNPDDERAVVMEFATGQRPDTIHAHVVYSDNPFFPSVLDAERQYLECVDDDRYRHVWLGAVNKVSDALIFRGKFVSEPFTPHADWPTYVGLDFGHASDPCAAVLVHVNDRTLYVSREFWALRAELDQLSTLLESAIPGSRQQRVYCDNSRPESIQFLRRHGHPEAVAAAKWPNSIIDGIAFLRSFERIIIAPECTHTLMEFRSYSYVLDRLTGQPAVEPQDKDNHIVDSLRYALSSLIKSAGEPGILGFYRDLLSAQAAENIVAANAPKSETLWHRAGAVTRDL
jgi:phage terminase large subunit